MLSSILWGLTIAVRLAAAVTPDRNNIPAIEESIVHAQHMFNETDLIRKLEDTLPENVKHTVHIHRANEALLHQESAWLYQDDWVSHLNHYLDHFDVAPLRVLHKSGPLLSRLAISEEYHSVGKHGPLISVIMVSYNANDTIAYASASILGQTWRSLELIIVDDCSSDNTWQLLMDIKASDSRVRLLRNKVRVGPYVSKNMALGTTRGEYITGHDADDWAHPQRLETQVNHLMHSQGTVRANFIHALRIQDSGVISLRDIGEFSPDGAAIKASISPMFENKLLKEILGHWDSVWYGADLELMMRAKRVLGEKFHELDFIGMFCRDSPHSLGKQGYDSANDTSPDTTSDTKPNPVSNRKQYVVNFIQWHEQNVSSLEGSFLDFPLRYRRFPVPEGMAVDIATVCSNLRAKTCGDSYSLYPYSHLTSFVTFFSRVTSFSWGQPGLLCLVVAIALMTFWLMRRWIFFSGGHHTSGKYSRAVALQEVKLN